MISSQNERRLIVEALYYAIRKLTQEEKERGCFSESAQLAGWKALLKEMEA